MAEVMATGSYGRNNLEHYSVKKRACPGAKLAPRAMMMNLSVRLSSHDVLDAADLVRLLLLRSLWSRWVASHFELTLPLSDHCVLRRPGLLGFHLL